jgi:hypothetical protein
MSDHLQEPDEQGDVVDQTEMDQVAGPATTGVAGALAEDAPRPEEPAPSMPETAGESAGSERPPNQID